ncbi:MAG: tautomerase family protein [Phycisphaerales bacterium]|nr:MAG: tautomerase family protein [Phycisphaerales bacterium]
MSFPNERKAELIEKVTEATVQVAGEAMRDVTWVVIDELKAGTWAIGGKPVSL